MAIRNIVKIGDDILRKVCRTQLTFDDRLALTADRHFAPLLRC